MAGSVIGEALVDIKANTSGFLSGIQGAMGSAEGMVGKMSDSMSGKMKGVGGIMSAGLTAPILAVGAFALESSSVVGGAMNKMVRQTGETGAAAEALKGNFKNVFGNTSADAGTVSAVMATLHQRLNVSGKDLEALSLQTINLSKLTGISADSIADSTSKMGAAWHLTGFQVKGVQDELYAISAKTGVSVTDMSNALAKVGAVATAAGVPMTTMEVSIGAMAAAGIPAKQSVSVLTEAIAKMKEKGMDAGKEMPLMMERLAAGTGTAADKAMLGEKNFLKLNGALGDSAHGYNAVKAAVEGADGSINKQAKDTETFSEKLLKFKNQLMLAFEPLGKVIIKVFSQVLEAAQPILGFLTKIMTAFSNMPAPIQMLIVIIGGIAAAMGPVLMLIGMMIPALTVIGPIIMGTILPAILPILLPLLAIVAAVIIIGVLLQLLYTRFKPFHDAVDQVTKWIKLLLGDLMSGDFGKLGEDFKKGILGALDVIKKFDWGSIPAAIFNALKSLDWGGAFETLKKFFMSGGLAGMLFNALKSLDWGSAFETLKKFFMSGGLAGMLFRALVSIDWGGLGMAIWNAVKSFFNPKFFTLLTDQLLGIGQWLWDNITSKLIGFGVWFIMLQATIGIRLWSWIIAALSGFGTWLWSLISPLPMQLWNAYVSFWSQIGTWLWGLISPLPGQLWNGIVSALGSFGSWLLGLLPDIGGQIWTSITNALGNLGNWIAGLFTQAHIEFDIPVINQHVSFNLARGGMVKARPGGVLAVIGEGGEDEYVVPASKLGDFGEITSAPRMAGGGMVSGGAVSSFSSSKAAATGGDFHFAISIENATLTSLDEADKMGQQIAYRASEAMRRAGHTRG